MRTATVVVAIVGDTSLTFVRCHHEDRRAALMAKHLTTKSTLIDAVKVGIAMANSGQIPGKDGKRGKTTELMMRCRSALLLKNSAAEVDAKKLSKVDQLAWQ